MKGIIFSILLISSPSVLLAGPAQFISGQVTQVKDGDTATIRRASDGKIFKIRFYGIDSPETEWKGRWPAQPYSQVAQRYLSKLILGKNVAAKLNGDMTHKRYLGEVFVNGYSASREMTRAGLAWWSKRYKPNDTDLQNLENQARAKRKGLWRDSKPVPPWAHRKNYN